MDFIRIDRAVVEYSDDPSGVPLPTSRPRTVGIQVTDYATNRPSEITSRLPVTRSKSRGEMLGFFLCEDAAPDSHYERGFQSHESTPRATERFGETAA